MNATTESVTTGNGVLAEMSLDQQLGCATTAVNAPKVSQGSLFGGIGFGTKARQACSAWACAEVAKEVAYKAGVKTVAVAKSANPAWSRSGAGKGASTNDDYGAETSTDDAPTLPDEVARPPSVDIPTTPPLGASCAAVNLSSPTARGWALGSAANSAAEAGKLATIWADRGESLQVIVQRSSGFIIRTFPALINVHGDLVFRDQHIDIFSRIAFPFSYMISCIILFASN